MKAIPRLGEAEEWTRIAGEHADRELGTTPTKPRSKGGYPRSVVQTPSSILNIPSCLAFPIS